MMCFTRKLTMNYLLIVLNKNLKVSWCFDCAGCCLRNIVPRLCDRLSRLGNMRVGGDAWRVLTRGWPGWLTVCMWISRTNNNNQNIINKMSPTMNFLLLTQINLGHRANFSQSSFTSLRRTWLYMLYSHCSTILSTADKVSINWSIDRSLLALTSCNNTQVFFTSPARRVFVFVMRVV